MTTEQAAKSGRNYRLQSSVEHISMYVIAIIIIMIVAGVLFSKFSIYNTVPQSTCEFTSGAYCIDILVATNSVTSNTAVFLYLSNAESYAVSNASIIVAIKGYSNSSSFNCFPYYVKPGGAILCEANMTTDHLTTNQFISGSLYLASKDCVSGTYSSACGASAPKETYTGSFSTYTQSEAVNNFGLGIQLYTSNSPIYANNKKSELRAVVTLNGQVIPGATVTFGANSVSYTLSPTYSNTNSSGNVISYISSKTSGNVLVSASFASISSNAVLDFLPVSSPSSNTVIVYYAPITITNNQISSTLSPFQQMVPVNALKYSAYEANDLGNIRFSTNAINTPSGLPANVLYYLPVTITNPTNTPTPANFQQLVSFDPAAICNATICAPHLNNTEFTFSNSVVIKSWLEGSSSFSNNYGSNDLSTATNVTEWVLLPANFVAAHSSNTIVIAFVSNSTNLFSNTVTGEAPQLTAQYAKYDNGNSIFNFYDNFYGSTLNTNKWITFNSGNPGYIVDNGILLKSEPYTGVENYIGENVISYNDPIVLDYYGWQDAPSNLGSNIFYYNSQSRTTGGYLGNALSYFWNQNNPPYNPDTFQQAYNGGGTVLFYLPFDSNNFQNISEYSMYVSPTGTNVILQKNYQTLFSANTFNNIHQSGYFGIGIGGADGSGTGQYVQWYDERTYPPNGIMPTVNVGSLTSTATNTAYLNSWCESGCTSSSSNAVFWVKLTNTIGANGNVVLNMVFLPVSTEYDDVYAGEAPQLTVTGYSNVIINNPITYSSANASDITGRGAQVYAPDGSAPFDICVGALGSEGPGLYQDQLGWDWNAQSTDQDAGVTAVGNTTDGECYDYSVNGYPDPVVTSILSINGFTNNTYTYQPSYGIQSETDLYFTVSTQSFVAISVACGYGNCDSGVNATALGQTGSISVPSGCYLAPNTLIDSDGYETTAIYTCNSLSPGNYEASAFSNSYNNTACIEFGNCYSGGAEMVLEATIFPNYTDTTLAHNYAKYDNGRNVFDLYDNFFGGTLNTSIWQTQLSGGSYFVNNGIDLTAQPGSYAFIQTKNPVDPLNYLVESFSYFANLSQQNGAFIGYIPLNLGPNQQNLGTTPYSGGSYSLNNYNGGVTGINIAGSITNYQVWSISTNAIGSTLLFNYSKIATETGSYAITNPNYPTLGSDAVPVIAQWFDLRTDPPNGIMPTVTFGNVIT